MAQTKKSFKSKEGQNTASTSHTINKKTTGSENRYFFFNTQTKRTNQKNFKDFKVTRSKLGQSKASKMSLNKDGAIQFEALENANTFKSFYSELTVGLQEKLPRAPNKFSGYTTKNYYAKTSCNVSNDFEFSSVS